MHWKVARDRFYRELDPCLLAEAGFFADTAREDAPLAETDWLCTPLRRVRLGLQADPAATAAVGPPVVLLSTGAFCPLHRGHLAMMEAARQAAIAAGWWVVGGYLSPGHDEYLTLKLGAAAVDAPTRVAQCARAAAEETDWLEVDPWEALHCTVAVNFTDVIVHLEAYLRHHLDPRLEVAYVFGSDNARFALTFQHRGRAIGVARPGYADAGVRYQGHPQVRANPRILWAHSDHAGSSTRVRAGEQALLPTSLRAPRPEDRPIRRLLLRDEGPAAALPRWPHLHARWADFQSGLEAHLRAFFPVQRVPLAQQLAAVSALGTDTISLDPMLPAVSHNLAISRAFDLGGYRCWGHVARPGAPPLEVQAHALPPGSYVLVDDDRVTGATLARVRSLLPSRVQIRAEHPLLSTEAGEELADSRDFLLGSAAGGAVVSLPDGTLGRVPYLLPYIDPAARSSLPTRAIHAFSAALWGLNAAFFAGSGLTLSDLPAAAQAPLQAIGLAPTAALEAICSWHQARVCRIQQGTAAQR